MVLNVSTWNETHFLWNEMQRKLLKKVLFFGIIILEYYIKALRGE